VATGRAFFGADAYLPAYYEELEPLSRYLPDAARILLAEPSAITRAIQGELERAKADAAAKADEPHFLVSTFYRDEDAIAADLATRSVVTLHATAVAG